MPQALSLNLSLFSSFPLQQMGKQVVEKWQMGGEKKKTHNKPEEAKVECFLSGIRVAGSSSPPWERVRTGAAPVQMLRKARHVPAAPAWVRLRGRDRGGGLSRPEIAFQAPVRTQTPAAAGTAPPHSGLWPWKTGKVGGGREVVCRERTLGDRGGEFPASGPRGELQAGAGE